MTIRLNGQTSGYVELESPAVAGSNTLVLPTGNGTNGQYLQTNGSGTLSWQTVSASNLTRATAQATTSGTSIDFTGIPSGVRRIQLLLDQVSISTGDTCQVQLGDSGGFETSGYDYSSIFIHTGNHGSSAYTAGFGIRWEAPECNRSGIMEIVNLTGNVWVARHMFDTNSSAQSSGLSQGAGRKELSGELTQIRLTTVGGTATFDNGQANIIYEV